MLKQTEHHFPADHPTVAGHFPGNPVIPGAVLIDTVVTAITAAGGGEAIGDDGACRLRSAKFLQPVRPGDRMVIAWQATPAKESRFTCTVDDRPVLNGSLAR